LGLSSGDKGRRNVVLYRAEFPLALIDGSRTQRTVVNDADRLRKYLHKHGLSWETIVG
jgi:sigma54-dependent transcription regulator